MRIEDVVVSPAWYPFGGSFGTPERREKRVYLNKTEQRLLRRAAGLLERLREAVDPHEWNEYGAAADVPERTRVLASAESFVGEVALWGEYVPVDDEPRVMSCTP